VGISHKDGIGNKKLPILTHAGIKMNLSRRLESRENQRNCGRVHELLLALKLSMQLTKLLTK
jgi:hypothetical protein